MPSEAGREMNAGIDTAAARRDAEYTADSGETPGNPMGAEVTRSDVENAGRDWKRTIGRATAKALGKSGDAPVPIPALRRDGQEPHGDNFLTKVAQSRVAAIQRTKGAAGGGGGDPWSSRGKGTNEALGVGEVGAAGARVGIPGDPGGDGGDAGPGRMRIETTGMSRKSEVQILRELEEKDELARDNFDPEDLQAHSARMYWKVIEVIEAQRLRAAMYLFGFTLLSVTLMILEIEVAYRVEGGSGSWAANIFKIALLLSNVACVRCVYLYHSAQFRVRRFMSRTAESRFTGSRRFVYFIVEAVLTMAMVPPFVNSDLRVRHVNGSPMPDVIVEIDSDVLNWFIFFRLVVAMRVVLYASQWYSHAARILGHLANITFDLPFVTKTMAKMRPFSFLFWATFPFVAALAYGFYISERESHSLGMTIFDSLWFLFATMIAIGYGDTRPENHVGRMLAVMAASTGVLGLALLVAFVAERLRLGASEERVVDLLERSRSRSAMHHAAARAIQAAWQHRRVRLALERGYLPVDMDAVERAMRTTEATMFARVREYRIATRRHKRALEAQEKDSIIEDISDEMEALVDRVSELGASAMQLKTGDLARYACAETAIERHHVWYLYNTLVGGAAEGQPTPNEKMMFAGGALPFGAKASTAGSSERSHHHHHHQNQQSSKVAAPSPAGVRARFTVSHPAALGGAIDLASGSTAGDSDPRARPSAADPPTARGGGGTAGTGGGSVSGSGVAQVSRAQASQSMGALGSGSRIAVVETDPDVVEQRSAAWGAVSDRAVTEEASALLAAFEKDVARIESTLLASLAARRAAIEEKVATAVRNALLAHQSPPATPA